MKFSFLIPAVKHLTRIRYLCVILSFSMAMRHKYILNFLCLSPDQPFYQHPTDLRCFSLWHLCSCPIKWITSID